MQFGYGKAALAILILAIVSGGGLLLSSGSSDGRRPDLIFATFTKEHAAAYKPAVEQFEKDHHVKIQIQVVDQRALQGRLQSAMSVGAPVPDMVELLDGTMGIFCRGAIEDIGFVDLTKLIHSSGLYDSLVATRFTKWSSRGHIFALPHDVHPMMLAYRRDLVEKLGIDVKKLTTWDEFARVGREIVSKDLDGDGVYDRYMIDLPQSEPWALRALMLQRGVGLVDSSGAAAFDDPRAVDVVCWYIKQTQGKDRIAFPCGWGQNLAKSMLDGLCLFYICPDWRTSQFQADVSGVGGKMSLMPLPAWDSGGIRTSTWGGTGLAFTKQSRNFDLAWKLAMHLYYDPQQLGLRFAATNILPPLKAAWNQPQFDEPRAFYSGVRLGRVYAQLAGDVPQEQSSAYMQMTEAKLVEAFANCALYHQENGEAGLREYAQKELKRCADQVRVIVNRNVFLKADAQSSAN